MKDKLNAERTQELTEAIRRASPQYRRHPTALHERKPGSVNTNAKSYAIKFKIGAD